MPDPYAARVGDQTGHPGMPPGAITGPPVPTVLIGKKPAVTAGALHACGFTGNPPHPPNPIPVGCPTVLIGQQPALRVGDKCACGAEIKLGETSVIIGGG